MAVPPLTRRRITLPDDAACPLCDSDDAAPLLRSRAQMPAGEEWFSFVRCRLCGLVYLRPRVPLHQLARYYGPAYLPHRGPAAWGRWAALAEEGQRRTDRARVRWARGIARLGPGAAVLDVGCGRPTFLEALVRRTGSRATGTDTSDAGWVKDAARWAEMGIELHRGPLGEVPVEGPFDLACLWHSLEHDYQPLDTLRRLRALARPGSALLVEVPNYDSLTRRIQGGAWAGFHTPRHTAAYTPATLRAVLERTGWTVARLARHGTLDPYVLWWLGRQEMRGRALEGNLESAFPWFMLGKLLTLPVAAMQRWASLGVMVAVGRAG